MRGLKLTLIMCYFFTACGNTNNSEKEMEMNEQIEKILSFDDFTPQQFVDWNDLMEKWWFEDFKVNYLDLKNIIQDCIDCADITIVVSFFVDDQGMIGEVDEIEDVIDCPNRSIEELLELKKEVINSFKKLIIPESLRNVKLNVPIGRSTLC